MKRNIQLEQDMVDAIANLDDLQVISCAKEMLENEYSSLEIEQFLNLGLKKVGELFENGEYFIADLMYSGMLYRSVLDLFSPNIRNTTSPTKGRILIGVVEKDIHDIGKDIVCAAVSVLVINTLNSIERFTDDKTSCVSDENSGTVEFRFKDHPSHDAALLLDSMILGLEDIEDSEEYESYIDIIFKEV